MNDNEVRFATELKDCELKEYKIDSVHKYYIEISSKKKYK